MHLNDEADGIRKAMYKEEIIDELIARQEKEYKKKKKEQLAFDLAVARQKVKT
jgi:hypothetical protein